MFQSAIFFCLLAFLSCSFEEVYGQCKSIPPCHCFEVTKQIRCENIAEDNGLTSDVLKNIGDQVAGEWDYLYISNTKLNAIIQGTFTKATFHKIIIQDNNNLNTIHEGAFGPSDRTELLQIRNNKNLVASGLFKIARLFGKGLKKVFLDNNKINAIDDSAFAGDANHFQILENIYLDAQQDQLKIIPTNFIKNVPKLLQVSLEKNHINSIKDGAFDLSATNLPNLPQPLHLTIFLNDNNELKEDELTTVKFKLPTSPHPIRLDLERCGITDFKLPFVQLINAIAKEAEGKVYLSGNIITTCNCEQVKVLMAVATRKNIWGISPDLLCIDKKFDQCLKTF